MQVLILYGLLATLTSFLCSLLEASFLSVPPVYIEGLRNGDSKKPKHKVLGEKAHRMQERQNRSLAAILTCNTIANTIGATGFGAEVENNWPGARIYNIPVSIIAATIFTLTVLFFAEILPKTIGALYHKALLSLTVKCIALMTFLVFPLVWLCESVNKLFKIPVASAVSRDEIFTMVKRCSDGGDISQKEVGIIKHLFLLRTTKVSDICTPRTVITGFPAHFTVRQALDTKAFVQFSRVPVFRSFPDDCVGYVVSSALLNKAAVGEYDTSVVSLTRELLPISEHLSVAEATDQFLTSKQHMMRVIGDFGETAGLLTFEDCLETLLGVEVVDEMDIVVDLRDYAKKLARDRSIRLKKSTITVPEEPAPVSETLMSHAESRRNSTVNGDVNVIFERDGNSGSESRSA
ncbi:hypothetical protein P9112_005972 [Eukaryota sp. TZLM1-RC]